MRTLILLVSFCCFSIVHAAGLMPITYLTFEQEDTSTGITINFLVEGDAPASYAYVDQQSRLADYSTYARKVQGRVDTIKKVNFSIHHVKLENLKANTTYYFVVGDEKIGFSKEYKFRTLPNDNSSIRLVIGGDMSPGDRLVETARSAMAKEPHAIVIGGDIAYADGKVENQDEWVKWFEKMNEIMITPKGFLTPLILAIGNHETTIGAAIPFNKVTYFYKLFAQRGEKSYFARKLGQHTGMIILDSGHATVHRKQKKFIEKSLKKYADKAHRLAVYHAPLYPSHRSYEDIWAQRGRRSWLKYFDQYNLTAAFEHHDHSLKRTKILRDNKVSTKGTVYLGDGCWGKRSRDATESRWYLEKSANETHVWFVTISDKDIQFKAMGKEAELFDHFLLNNSTEQTYIQEMIN